MKVSRDFHSPVMGRCPVLGFNHPHMFLFWLALSLAHCICASQSGPNRMDLGNFLFVRSFTPEPLTDASPYILTSHNLERDLEAGYFNSFNEMIDRGLDIIVLNPKISSRKGTSFSFCETTRATIPRIMVEMDIINIISYGRHAAFRYIKEKIGDTSSIVRIVYDTSSAEDSLIIHIKDLANISSYVIGFDLDDNRESCEIADCANINELELYKQVYCLGNVTRSYKGESSAGLSLWNTAIYDHPIKSLITIFLKPEDNPDLFWNLMKDIMEDDMAKSYIARICLRRFFGSGMYILTFYLPQSPSMNELERYRSILMRHLGPLTTFNETTDVHEGISLFSTVRVKHSELTLSVKMPNQKGNKSIVVESEIQFRAIMNQNSNALSYKISRTFLPKHSVSDFPAQLTLPLSGKKALFENVVSCIFFSKFFYFSDQVSMVEVRSAGGKLILYVTFHFMNKENRKLALDLLVILVNEKVKSTPENIINTPDDLAPRLTKPTTKISEPNAKNCKLQVPEKLSERSECEPRKIVLSKKRPARRAEALIDRQQAESDNQKSDTDQKISPTFKISEPDLETVIKSPIEAQSESSLPSVQETEEQPSRKFVRVKRSLISSSSKTQKEDPMASSAIQSRPSANAGLEKMTNREFEAAFRAFNARLHMKTFEEHLQSRIN